MNQRSYLTLVVALSIAAATVALVEYSPQAKAKHTTTVCVNDQPCRTQVWNSTDNTQDTSNMRSVCINDKPCSTIIDKTS
jgi:hypothetical protein